MAFVSYKFVNPNSAKAAGRPPKFLVWLVRQTCRTEFSKGPNSSSNSIFPVYFLLLPNNSKSVNPCRRPGAGYLDKHCLGIIPLSHKEVDLESDI